MIPQLASGSQVFAFYGWIGDSGLVGGDFDGPRSGRALFLNKSDDTQTPKIATAVNAIGQELPVVTCDVGLGLVDPPGNALHNQKARGGGF